jgi:outer membrane protein assembly factor BamA
MHTCEIPARFEILRSCKTITLYNGAARAFRYSMMKTFCLSLMLMIPVMASGQIVPTISKTEIAGASDQVLSVDLRDSMQKLVGQRYDPAIVDPIVRRIESELPDYVVATRNIPESDPGLVRLVFVVAPKAPGSTTAESNVNSQYVVESVEVKGITQSQYSSALHDEMQNMVGLMLDSMKVDDLRRRLRSEPLLMGKYSVSNKIERGSQPGHVKVVFEASKMPWALRVTVGNKIDINGNGINMGNAVKDTDIVESAQVKGVTRSAYSDGLDSEIQLMVGKRVDHLEADHLKEQLDMELKHRYDVKENIRKGTKPDTVTVVYDAELIPWIPNRTLPEVGTYHPQQGISAFVDGIIYKGVTLGMGTDGDSYIERYKGYTTGYEARMLGTPRFGVKVRFDAFGMLWKSQTLDNLLLSPTLPGAYRSRHTIEPSVAFAFSPSFYATAGANFTELEMMLPTEHRQSAHKATASLVYKSPALKHGSGTNEFAGGYEIRSGTRTLDSDFVYTRHYWDARYTGKFGKNKLTFSYFGGIVTGAPPMFERFSLGNTQTLRGWNKYDIDPIGGDRVFHFSTEWSYKYFGAFMDNGSIWTSGQDATNRSSIGVFLGPLKLAVPIKCSADCGVTFLIRFD